MIAASFLSISWESPIWAVSCRNTGHQPFSRTKVSWPGLAPLRQAELLTCQMIGEDRHPDLNPGWTMENSDEESDERRPDADPCAGDVPQVVSPEFDVRPRPWPHDGAVRAR